VQGDKRQYVELRGLEVDLPLNVVAAMLYAEGGLPTHAALLIRYNGENQIFHFYQEVLLHAEEHAIDEGQLVFIKEINFIPAELIPSFLAHCELIQKEAAPKFGYFYDPRSFYDEDGKFQNPGAFPEYMTCVGFCLTVLQSYLGDQMFLYYPDWDKQSYDLGEKLLAYLTDEIRTNYPQITVEDISKEIRRILPVEYFSGAYADHLPVRKQFTDILRTQIESQISIMA
jgi:hypothetical protein